MLSIIYLLIAAILVNILSNLCTFNFIIPGEVLRETPSHVITGPRSHSHFDDRNQVFNKSECACKLNIFAKKYLRTASILSIRKIAAEWLCERYFFTNGFNNKAMM